MFTRSEKRSAYTGSRALTDDHMPSSERTRAETRKIGHPRIMIQRCTCVGPGSNVGKFCVLNMRTGQNYRALADDCGLSDDGFR